VVVLGMFPPSDISAVASRAPLLLACSMFDRGLRDREAFGANSIFLRKKYMFCLSFLSRNGYGNIFYLQFIFDEYFHA
jgi:hypothetical protein